MWISYYKLYYFFEQRVFTHLHITVNANVSVFDKTYEGGNPMCFALFAWFAQAALLAGIAKTAMQAKHEWVQNTWSIGTGLCFTQM